MIALDSDLSTLACLSSSVSSSFRADMTPPECAEALPPAPYLKKE
jgi:hypothetical protein